MDPERDLPVEHHVVHRHQVRRPVPVDGRSWSLRSREQVRGLRGRHGDLVALRIGCAPADPATSAFTARRSRWSRWPGRACPRRRSRPGGGPGTPGQRRRTESSVHMPSAEPCSPARKAARILGGSITAATPPCTTNTSPLMPAAPGRRGTPPAARRAPGERVGRPAGGAPIRSAVMAVLARGQMALARTPYLPQLRAVVTVSAAIPALARRSWAGRRSRAGTPRRRCSRSWRAGAARPLAPLPPVRGGEAGGDEVAPQVQRHHEIPFLRRHREDHPVREYAGVVDEDVQPPNGRARPPPSPRRGPFAGVAGGNGRRPACRPDLRRHRCAASPGRSLSTSRAPAAASASASARPSAFPAPATIAARPSSVSASAIAQALPQ